MFLWDYVNTAMKNIKEKLNLYGLPIRKRVLMKKMITLNNIWNGLVLKVGKV